MSLTVTIPGAVLAEVGATAPATLVLELGVPGPTGAAGAAGAAGATGAGVAAGGSSGQALIKDGNQDFVTTWAYMLPLSGGAMTNDSSITIQDTIANNSELAALGLKVQLTADNAQGTTVEFDGLDTYDGSGHMMVKPTGLTFPNASVQSTAFLGYASPAFTGNPTAPTASPGDNDTTIATTAFVTTADNLKANLASPTFTGTVTIPSGASITGFAPLASPTFTGTPLSTTASVSTNTTQIATTAFVLGQVGTATPIVNGTAAVGTSLLYAREDHVHGTDTTRAALASPTFSGSPSLPTGSIGVTQSPGNNTTALATTAFVTAAVPAFATNAQAQTGSSTTLGMSPASSSYAKSSPSYFRLSAMTAQSSTSGVGAAGQITVNGYNSRCPTTALGYGILSWIHTFHSRGASANVAMPFPWGKRFVAQFRYHARTLGTDANTVNRVNFGKPSGATTGDLALRGVGIKQVANGVLQLMVHNGTTLTAVSSTFTPSTTVSTDIRIESDGSGNVTLYSNDVSIATTSAGPNSSGSSANYYITIESENLALITGTSNGQYVSEITAEFAI